MNMINIVIIMKFRMKSFCFDGTSVAKCVVGLCVGLCVGFNVGSNVGISVGSMVGDMDKCKSLFTIADVDMSKNHIFMLNNMNIQ